MSVREEPTSWAMPFLPPWHFCWLDPKPTMSGSEHPSHSFPQGIAFRAFRVGPCYIPGLGRAALCGWGGSSQGGGCLGKVEMVRLWHE